MKSGSLAGVLTGLMFAAGGVAHALEFQSEVLPIFSQRCGKCHMEGKSKGGLALDLEKISKEIGPSKAIVPGDADKSDLIKVMMLPQDDEDRMPPENAPMPENEIGVIKTWISEGAKLPTDEPKPDEKKKEEAKPETAAAPEKWTSSSGTSITASLVRVDVARKAIVLKTEDGRTVEVPIAKLDEDSKARAKAFWESHK